MASKVIHGRDVNVLVDVSGLWTYIGCATDSTFEFDNEIIGKTDVNAGLFRKKRVRISDSRASVSGVSTTEGGDKVGQFYFLQEGVRRTEQSLKFLFIDEAGVDTTIEMTALVRSISINSDTSNFSEFDIGFEGTGNITISTLEPPESGSLCPNVLSDWWETTEGETSISGASFHGTATTLAGKTIIEVDREGMVLNPVSGVPGNGQYRYTGTTIEVSPSNPFNPGETMFVIWEE